MGKTTYQLVSRNSAINSTKPFFHRVPYDHFQRVSFDDFDGVFSKELLTLVARLFVFGVDMLLLCIDILHLFEDVFFCFLSRSSGSGDESGFRKDLTYLLIVNLLKECVDFIVVFADDIWIRSLKATGCP